MTNTRHLGPPIQSPGLQECQASFQAEPDPTTVCHRHDGVTYRYASQLCILVIWVLPCLWQQSVVPVDVVGVEPQLAFLGVLLDRGARLILHNAAGAEWKVVGVQVGFGPLLRLKQKEIVVW